MPARDVQMFLYMGAIVDQRIVVQAKELVTYSAILQFDSGIAIVGKPKYDFTVTAFAVASTKCSCGPMDMKGPREESLGSPPISTTPE